MTATPVPAKEFNAAKQAYIEQFGGALVTNTYLKLALVLVCLCCGGLVTLNYKTYQTFSSFKPIIIRVNEIGRAEALSYDASIYTPRDSELKYFLIQFVTHYYGRSRATIRNDWPRSLYYLESRMADGLMATARKDKFIETFLSGSSEEVEVTVTRVALEDIRNSPYRATVDYEKVYYTPYDRQETRRQRFSGNFTFIIQEHVSNALIPHNPLGLTITYFREDQSFQ